MRNVALIYNPASGQHSSRRAQVISEALEVLRGAGIEATAYETQAPGSATLFAGEAMARGCDTIVACGGDGTVHEVMQQLVGTEVALGVVPLGTANVLAQALGLGTNAVKAVHALLTATAQAVPVGRIHYRDESGAEQSRYFTVAAGIGADALLMARMDAKLKRKLGYVLYVIEGFKVWATGPFPLFEARLKANGGAPRVEEVSQVLAVRVRSFGGALGVLTPGSTLLAGDIRLLAIKTRSRWRYLRFLLATVAGRQTFSEAFELLSVDAVECLPRNGSSHAVYAEADGEWLGTLPARMEIAPLKLKLLVPTNAKP